LNIVGVLFGAAVLALLAMTAMFVLVPVFVAAYGPKCRDGDVPVAGLGKHPVVCVAGYKPTEDGRK
jgi:hypothetical protein